MPFKDKKKQTEAQRAWYLRNKEKIIEKNRKHRKRLRDIVNSYKDMPCVDCNIKYIPEVMDLHHPDQKQKEDNLSALVRKFANEDRIRKEAASCIPLCSNCHRIRHVKNGSFGRHHGWDSNPRLLD